MQPLGNELRRGLQLSSIAGLAHAERLNASRAARTNDLAFLPRCTFYTSAEPCAKWGRDLGRVDEFLPDEFFGIPLLNQA